MPRLQMWYNNFTYMNIEKIKKQRGVALLLSLMMIAFIVLLVVFVSSIGSGQLRFAGSSTDSTRAFSAADAGIEYALSRINLGLTVGQDAASCKCGAAWCPTPELTSSSVYCITADDTAKPKKITAIGRTTDTSIRRSIEVVLPAFGAVNGFATFCTSGVSTLNLNTFCTTNVYAGATGIVGFAPGVCGVNQFPVSSIARTDIALTTLAGNYYVVQCYK